MAKTLASQSETRLRRKEQANTPMGLFVPEVRRKVCVRQIRVPLSIVSLGTKAVRKVMEERRRTFGEVFNVRERNVFRGLSFSVMP